MIRSSSASALRQARSFFEGATESSQQERVSSAAFDHEALPSALSDLVRYSGLTSRQIAQHITICLLGAMVWVAIAIVSSFPLILIAIPAQGVLHLWLIAREGFRRAEGFERDYVAFLMSLAASVRTGQDVLHALRQSGDLFPRESELAKQIQWVQEAIDKGATEEVAIGTFGESIRHPDIRLFITAVILARKEGSSLADCLERLARTTRQRQSFRRKARSAIAMQRLSAIGIACAAVVMLTMQSLANSSSVLAALENPVGVRMYVAGGGFILLGTLWMMSLSKARL